MSTEQIPTPPRLRPRDIARMNAVLFASGIDYQLERDVVDAAAFTRAFAKRFPKTFARLAD